MKNIFSELLMSIDGWYSKKCTMEWKKKDMSKNRFLIQLKVSTIKEGLAKMLPTPTAGIVNGSEMRADGTPRGLGAMAKMNMLPTPTAYDWNTPRKPETFKAAQLRHKEKGVNLQNPLKQMAIMGLLPTPTATDWKGAYPPTSIDNFPARRNMMRNAYQYENKEYNPKTSQLNPRFVEEMMGFPENWTSTPFLIK